MKLLNWKHYKSEIAIVIVVSVMLGFCFFVAKRAVDYVDKRGLKSVVERLWEGAKK